MSLPKKLIFAIILLLSTFVFSKSVLAAWYVQPPEVWGPKVFTSPEEEVFKERYIASVVVDIGETVYCTLADCLPSQTGSSSNQGAIGLMTNLIGYLYIPPASSVEYLADLGQNLGIVKPAYAQGLGFSAFSPVLGLWKILRNIAYLGFVVIFVIVGFMIMFRKKIDPRTVVTIQEALPRVVVALILVTFSYAIAGLLIDLMLFFTRLIAVAFLGPTHAELDDLLTGDLFSLAHPLGIGNVGKIGSAISISLKEELAGAPGTLIALLAQLSALIVFAIAAFFIMFKIFFMLLGSYIGIILSVIFAPVQLMLGALPGNNRMLANWFMGLFANILVFPATFVMLLISAFFQAASLEQRTGIWGISPGAEAVPEKLTWLPPLLGGAWASIIFPLISFGILFTIPAIGEAIKKTFQIQPSPLEGVAAKEIRGGISWVPFVGGMAGKMGI